MTSDEAEAYGQSIPCALRFLGDIHVRVHLTGILSLLLTAPSWAQNYVDSAVLDLSTLKFDGIGVTLTPQWQSHEAVVQELGINDTTIRTVNSTIQEGHVSVDRTVIADAPGFGSATAISDPTQLSAMIDLQGRRNAQSAVERDSVIHAQQTGFLTVSLQYTVAHSIVPSVVVSAPDTSVYGNGVHVHSYISLSDQGDLTSVHGELHGGTADASGMGSATAIQTGTLSLTRWFTQGQTMDFTMRTEALRSLIPPSGQSVPIPDMLWPALAGLIGVSFVAEWRRRRSSGR